MNLDEFRQEMASYRCDAEKVARALKDSYITLARLHDLYERLDSEERAMANHVLAEWTLSDDEGLRFDALTLIDDFRIATAVPVLRKLAKRLASSTSPGAPYEREKVERLLGNLGDL